MTSERVLDSSPSLVPLFARSAATIIPGSSRLPFLRGRGTEIPDLALSLPSVSVQRERLAAYDRVCGFSLADTLPPTYIHVLAFPLHLALMADSRFPFRAIGLVHVANEITQHRPVNVGETLSLRVSPSPLAPHPRGQQFSLRTEARVGEELVWVQLGTILRRRGSGSSEQSGGSASPPSTPAVPLAGNAELHATATWKLRGDLGRRYAAVSGDINPIHLHGLTGRLLGFPGAIAHGMWTKARCLAALEGRLPDSFTVTVSFRRPIVLPASVAFLEAPAPPDAGFEGLRFAVRDATPHLDGIVKFA